MDVTEQAEAAARLRASEEHFRVAFDNAPIGMSMISLAPEDRGRYLRTNAAFEADARLQPATSCPACRWPS